MSAEIEVIIDSEPIYSIDINTVDEIFEITTSNIENIYEVMVIEPTFFSSALIDDSTHSLFKTYSSEKIESIISTFSEVATSGSYADLNDKPIIPIVVAGKNIVIDNTNPAAPIISSTATGGGSINYGLLNTQINQLGGSF